MRNGGWVALVAMVAACGASEDSLTQRAGYDFGCAPGEVTVTELGSGTRGVEGCGQRATYLEVCDGRGPAGTARCRWVQNGASTAVTSGGEHGVSSSGDTEPAPTAALVASDPAAPPMRPDERDAILTVLSPHADGVRTCMRDETARYVVIDVDVEGRLSNLVLNGASDATLQCLAGQLTGLRLSGLGHAVSVRWNVDFGAARPAPAATRARDAVHALLAAHAADVVACVGHSPVGVRAAWDAAGHVTYSLQGDLAGHADEEQCVASVVGANAIDVAGEAGSMVDVVRAP